MRAKVLTLRFSPQLGRFDDAPLIALQQKVVLEDLREHLVSVSGESMLLCVAAWREKTDSATTTTSSATPPPVSEAPPVDEPRTPATPVAELRADFTAQQQGLFELLRRWRAAKAHTEGVPNYVILTNRQLVDIVRQRPSSRSALVRIHGFGDKKLARHGQEILAVLWPETPKAEAPSEDTNNPAFSRAGADGYQAAPQVAIGAEAVA